MKAILTLFLVFMLFSAIAQRTQEPTIYLNRKEINSKDLMFLNTGKIDSISVDKSTENGTLYLFTEKKVKFLSLNKIVRKYTDYKMIDSTLLFIINN